MQCPNCGKENQPGTRFCVHCGTPQASAAASAAPPTTVTAFMAQAGIAAGMREPSAAARVEDRPSVAADATTPLRAEAPGSETVLIAPGSSRQPAPPAIDPAQEAADWVPPPPSAPTSSSTPAGDTPSWDTPSPAHGEAPAYDTAPRGRSGMLIVLALAAIGVLGIGGFFYYQVSSDRAREAALASGAAPGAADTARESRPATSSAPSAGPTASGAVGDGGARPAPGAAPADAVRAEAASPAAASAPASAGPAAMTPSAATPSTPQEPAARPAPAPRQPRPATRPPAPRADTPAPAVAPPQPPPPAPTPAPKAAPAPAARPAPATDRWAQMTDDLARCTREDFINRVVCDQRVRLRYCDGYWGKVAQCPGAPNPDRGQ